MRICNIEEPEPLLEYLRTNRHIGSDEAPEFQKLSGGVSNRTVLVRRKGGGDLVIKQALEKLRVAVDWRSDPCRSHREALGLKWLARLTPAGRIPRLVFEDQENHLLAMNAVPEPHTNWKTDLLGGDVNEALVVQFGSLLGEIHRRAFESRDVIAPIFEDRTYFRTLRLEPYYEFAARRNPEASGFIQTLMVETDGIRETLVHGDYSPKNTLVHEGSVVLLDHEVIHWGDPAFDLGFSITHFVGKANHFGCAGGRYLNAARTYWTAYRGSVCGLFSGSEFEGRVVRHTLACLLARVDGRSPLEYLTTLKSDRQRRIALDLMARTHDSVEGLFDALQFRLNQRLSCE